MWDAPLGRPGNLWQNRERLPAGDIAVRFLAAMLRQRRVRALLSQKHLSAEDTPTGAWDSMKSYRRSMNLQDAAGTRTGTGTRIREAEEA